MIFRKSLLCLEKEKLFILSKELDYRRLICDFFDVEDETTESDKKDLEHSFRMLKYQIIELKKSIERNFETLSENIKKLDRIENQFSFEIESLIYLDMIREYIKYIVNKADTINIKISQLLRDGYNQYLPKPITGKRYSNANITSQVEYDLKNRLKKLLKNKDNIETMVIWDYDDNYKILNYEIKSKKSTHIVFKLSYWYFELTYFLPNLTHEIGHILQNKYDFLKPNDLENILNKSLKQYLKKNDREIFSEQLSTEIYSDIISFLYHGNSYLYAMTHKQLSEGLSHTFRAIDESCYNKNNDVIDVKLISSLEKFFKISPMRYREKRDIIFVRIYVLLNIRDIVKDNFKLCNKKELSDKFEFDKYNTVSHIKRLLNSIYYIDDIESTPNNSLNNSLKTYYDSYKNLQEPYNDLILFIKQSINTVTKYFESNKSILQKIFDLEQKNFVETSRYSKYLPTHFNEIWNKRFIAIEKNKTIHRFEYRKKLHKKLLEKLINNNTKEDKDPKIKLDEIKPYSMVFIKFRLDQVKTYESITEVKQSSIIAQGKVLGMYDYMYLKKLDETFKIDKIYKSKVIFENFKYYESYYSLMKILSDKKGEVNIDDTSNILSATIQIEVLKKLDNETEKDDLDSIYFNLYSNLVDINYILNKTNKKTYKKIEIFKSLGPKDIIIHIDRATVDTVYDLKKEFYNKFNRTYTTLYLNDSNLCFQDTNYYFVSNLRMSSGFTIKKFRKIYENENNIFTISLKTGVMDYVIVWKSDSKLEDIVDFYNQLLNEKLVYDIQTSIEEKLATN